MEKARINIDRNKRTKQYKASLIRITVITTLLFVMLTTSVMAQGMSSARSVAMGTAYTALANSIDAIRYNPANLGITSSNQYNLELLGFGANISNNSFSLGDYNKYTGAFLTDNDKAVILDKVPKEGLKLTAEADASALAFSKGPFAFAVTGIGLADVNLNKDILELVLNGNTFADTIDITGSYSEAAAFIAFSLSYGRAVYHSGTRQLAFGGTFKYLRGLGVEQVVELEGMAATFATGFAGNGKLVAQTADGGSGFAVDLGATLKFNEDYIIGARIKNFLSSLNWNKNTQEHGYIFSFDTMTIDNMGSDYIVSNDYTNDIGSFKTNLPSSMNIGFANTSGSFLWTIDWEQGFHSKLGISTKPRLSFGLEWIPTKNIPLRTGFSTGGNRNTAFSLGSGFHFPFFYFDYAIVTGTSLSGYSSKGLNFAVTTGFQF